MKRVVKSGLDNLRQMPSDEEFLRHQIHFAHKFNIVVNLFLKLYVAVALNGQDSISAPCLCSSFCEIMGTRIFRKQLAPQSDSQRLYPQLSELITLSCQEFVKSIFFYVQFVLKIYLQIARK